MGLFTKTPPTPISEQQKLLKEISTKSSEIKYMREKYDDFILQSVILDYDKFKGDFDQNGVDSRQKEFWHLTYTGSEEITLTKTSKVAPENQYSARTVDSRLSVKYTFGMGTEDFAIKTILLSGPISTSIAHPNKFTNIISQYFLYFKLSEVREEHERKSKDFQKMVSIIGKDVHRDSLIEQILSKND